MNEQLLNFHVPEPCHEDWDRMSPEAKGRFCATCETTVIDFTHASPNDIFAAYQASEGKMCGNFLPSQLGTQRTAPLTAERQLSFMRRFFMAALIVFGATLFAMPEAAAQQVDSLRTEVAEFDARGEHTSNIISGTVYNTTLKQPVANASVLIYIEGKHLIGAQADTAGNWKVEIPNGYEGQQLYAVANKPQYQWVTPTTVAQGETGIVLELYQLQPVPLPETRVHMILGKMIARPVEVAEEPKRKQK